MPCEDYGIKFENNECKIFVLGDGHGDSNCPRSSLGSKCVCEIAVDELQKFANDVKEQNWEQRLFCDKQAEKMIFRLVSSIFGKWSLRVKEDYLSNPLTKDEEKAATECLQYYRRGERIEHIYGTTFIAGLMSSDYLLLLQQGDGRCVVFDADGDVSQPIPWDDRCIANVATSVCDPDAVVSCRYHIIDLTKNQIVACFLGSDGVEDSFGSMDMMHKYYREELLLASTVEINEYEGHLLETLPRISEYGSGDDITICGVFNPKAINELTQKFIGENEKTKVLDLINKTQERLGSMGPKLAFLQKKCVDTESVCDQLKRKYQELEDEFQNIKADVDTHSQSKPWMSLSMRVLTFSSYSIKCLQRRLERINEEKDELSHEIQNALNKKKMCDDEYIAYKQKYDSFVKIKEEHENKYKSIATAITTAVDSQSEVSRGCDAIKDSGDTIDTNAVSVVENKETLADTENQKENTLDNVDTANVGSKSVVEDDQAEIITHETTEFSTKNDVGVLDTAIVECDIAVTDEGDDTNAEIRTIDEFVEPASTDNEVTVSSEITPDNGVALENEDESIDVKNSNTKNRKTPTVTDLPLGAAINSIVDDKTVDSMTTDYHLEEASFDEKKDEQSISSVESEEEKEKKKNKIWFFGFMRNKP